MIAPGERGVAIGTTGSGKSWLQGYYFASYPGQRLLVDVGDAYELGPAASESACTAREPGAIDWTRRTIRYVPSTLEQDEYNELYAAIWRRTETGSGLLVWLDEAEGPTTANRSPLHLRRAIKQGRKRALTHLSSTQRPRDVEKAIVTESEHAFVFRLRDPADIAFLAQRLNVTAAELGDTLARLPQYGFVYHSPAAGAAVFDPLDAGRLELTRRHIRMP